MKKQRSPGPAAYNIKSTVCSDAPAYSFGTMKRPAPNAKGISPGPVYLLKASLGRNRDHTFKAMPAFGFGTSERPDPAGNSKMREFLRTLKVSAPRVCALASDESAILPLTRAYTLSPRSYPSSEQTEHQGLESTRWATRWAP